MKTLVNLSFVLICLAMLSTVASAQGGWRQWEIHFLDGTKVEASPLQMRKDGRFTRSMDPKEAGYDRSTIDYLAASTKQLPPVPTGKDKRDLVVMLDGKQSSGKITFKALKFSEGTIVQNGKEMSLEKIAYIKFARPKPKITKKKIK
jgi:hypothetical protein